MIALANNTKELKVTQADISDKNFKFCEKYGIVTCLWNVLGHVNTKERRLTALINLASLMEDNGLLFIDVNNRYNVSNYGLGKVLKNIYKDIFHFDRGNGDYKLNIDTGDIKIQTNVHIFNPFEIEKLIKLAGLKIVKRWMINYNTGNSNNNIFGGQILYKLSKNEKGTIY